ncbi:malate dehydrogenase (quinone) [Luteococcus sp. H138]|uniref:malate dehydrogenase (quinone) n=1 Tax=unclassified Luteococcus TaxID=2639923 RepID=UPI00313BA99C
MVLAKQKPSKWPVEAEEVDVALIGGGVLSATIGLVLHELQPDWKIVGYERLAKVAKESSNPWNNAGTGHAGLCELNYTKERPDGTMNNDKPVQINEQFQQTRQLWAHLVEKGILGLPETFVNACPHMSIVHGEDDIEFLRKRWESLRTNPLFAAMEFSDDQEKIREWAPFLVEGRDPSDRIAVTYDPTGTDVDFGSITTQIFNYLAFHGVNVETSKEVTDLKQNTDGTWTLRIVDRGEIGGKKSGEKFVRAKFVFNGSGGWALKMLQKAKIPEVAGYALFPVTGAFMSTDDPDVVNNHKVKVYAKPPVGAPPMSNPHMDARVINGSRSVLFGPYAGIDPRFLKYGSMLDMPKMIRTDNLGAVLNVAKDNIPLIKMLATMIFMTPAQKLAEMRAFAPSASMTDWHMIKAGQRAQIIKTDAKGKGGSLEFGTEVVTTADGTLGAVLGASPGASTAVPIVLDVLSRCFPDKMGEWGPRFKEVIPSYGEKLSDNPERAYEIMKHTAEVLNLAPPVKIEKA